MLFPVVIKFSKYGSAWGGAGNCSYLESKWDVGEGVGKPELWQTLVEKNISTTPKEGNLAITNSHNLLT